MRTDCALTPLAAVIDTQSAVCPVSMMWGTFSHPGAFCVDAGQVSTHWELIVLIVVGWGSQSDELSVEDTTEPD